MHFLRAAVSPCHPNWVMQSCNSSDSEDSFDICVTQKLLGGRTFGEPAYIFKEPGKHVVQTQISDLHKL